jgi:hypothetical protein
VVELVEAVVAASTYSELDVDVDADADDDARVQSNQALPFSEGQAKLVG